VGTGSTTDPFTDASTPANYILDWLRGVPL
jgi:hypothetical protein